jgi:hypothetical protein
MGRPKLDAADVRSIDVTVALSRKEFKRISARAKKTRKRIASYLRHAGLDNSVLKIVPEINQDAAKHLRELQNLLSQLAVLFKQNQIEIIDPIIFVEMQKDLRQMHHDYLNYADNQNHDRK